MTPHGPSYPFLLGTAKMPCRPQRLGVEVPCHTRLQLLLRPADQWGSVAWRLNETPRKDAR